MEEDKFEFVTEFVKNKFNIIVFYNFEENFLLEVHIKPTFMQVIAYDRPIDYYEDD